MANVVAAYLSFAAYNTYSAHFINTSRAQILLTETLYHIWIQKANNLKHFCDKITKKRAYDGKSTNFYGFFAHFSVIFEKTSSKLLQIGSK